MKPQPGGSNLEPMYFEARPEIRPTKQLPRPLTPTPARIINVVPGAECLRGRTRNLLGSDRTSSNPVVGRTCRRLCFESFYPGSIPGRGQKTRLSTNPSMWTQRPHVVFLPIFCCCG